MISNNDCETVLRLQQLIAEEEMLWLKHFDSLTDTEAEVLILAKKMGQITNKDIRENIGLDTLQASSILRKFCKNNYLLQHGKSSNSYYLLNSCYTDNCDSLAGNDQSLAGASTGLNEPSYPNNEPSYPNNNQSLTDKNAGLTGKSLRIKTILELCLEKPLSSGEIARRLGLNLQGLRNRYLADLVKNEYLAYTYPDNPKDRRQTYITTDKGKTFIRS